MPLIQKLDSDTINKIAAGEVIERPAAVIKELVENAIDAKASAITIEIKEGGISFIRITDNGCGIANDDLDLAFMRHSTSKIKTATDLITVSSLGFRGEALSSIASVACVELITKTADNILGSRYIIEGGEKKLVEEIGCPQGTTFIVRNLFYNTPVRRKFLKSSQTEASIGVSAIERIAVSHPEISFKFIVNGQTKLHTTGNNNLKDIIYTFYGRDISKNILPINCETQNLKIDGYIAKPVVSRGNRNYELYFINGRPIRSNLISKAIEDAYKPYTMQHRYPFVVLSLSIDPNLIDVNVHPTKMEVRFTNSDELYSFIYNAIKDVLACKNMIQQVSVGSSKNDIIDDKLNKSTTYTASKQNIKAPEPFEIKRIEKMINNTFPKSILEANSVTKSSDLNESKNVSLVDSSDLNESKNLALVDSSDLNESKNLALVDSSDSSNESQSASPVIRPSIVTSSKPLYGKKSASIENTSVAIPSDNANINITNDDKLTYDSIYNAKQTSLFDSENFVKNNKTVNFTIVGQIFLTYWIIECNNNMYIIDQHAAHEKVLFERTMEKIKNRIPNSQLVSPPIIVTLDVTQQNILENHLEIFEKLGYEIEPFGGNEYQIKAVPSDLPGITGNNLLIEVIDELTDNTKEVDSEIMLNKVASLSCKAAIKGNNKISMLEAKQLIEDLMCLDNPFNCPHGRPTIISMSKYDIEKKFKRIV